MKYIPKLGDLVEVQWLDTTGYTNRQLSAVKLSRAVNIGTIARINKAEIVLQTGDYPDDPPDERVGDWTIIPRAWTDKVKLVKRGFKA